MDSCGKLRRQIDVRTAASVVIASMMGAGIFTTSGFIARDTGSPSIMLALWVVGGAISLAGALSYAELGAAMPRAGGEYVYLRVAYGPAVAYLSGWTSFFIGFSGAISVALLGLAAYAGHFVPEIKDSPVAQKLVALAALWLLTLVHLLRTPRGGAIQRILTGATVTGIALLVAAGFLAGRGSFANFVTSASAHGSATVSLIFVLYAYSGWNAASYIAGEISDPAANLPRALVAGTAMVTILYVSLNALYAYALPINAMSGQLAVAEKAAVAMFGGVAASAITILLMLAIAASASAMIMAGPRVYYAMAQDRTFARTLARVNPHSGVPANALIAQAAWSSMLIVFFGAFEPLVVYVGFALTAFTIAAVLSVIVLRLKRPDLPRPFRVPLYPYLPLAFISASSWIAIHTLVERPLESCLGIATVVAGLPIEYARRRMIRERGV
jgi:basic amino acid/polyamine antiporter, APA family